MKKLMLLALIGCTSSDTLPDATMDARVCTPQTACKAAESIAQAYCIRQSTCFSDVVPDCEEDIISSLCSENDCSAYYPQANYDALKRCLELYYAAPCAGPKPPTCKLY